MPKKSFIDSVRVEDPCREDWNEMDGNDRVRFCSHCSKQVNNLSEMTRKEASRLVRTHGSNLCIRYVQDPVTKRPLFAEQLLQITRRTPRLAAGVMTASMSLSTLAYAQGGAPSTAVLVPVNECPDKKPAKADEEKPAKALKNGKITGTVTDPNGAVVPSASVLIWSIDARTGGGTTTNGDGVFNFDDLGAGTYRVEAQAPGFVAGATEVTIALGGETAADIQLSVGISETVEVIAEPESRNFESVGGAIAIVRYSSPLAQAVANEDVDQIRELLANGANVNGKEEDDNATPLFIAVDHGNIEMVQMLLDAGAKVNARDNDRQTPLMRLDYDATPELVELLLRHGAKINLTDNENNTALILAAVNAPAEVIRALIDAGADVNVVNKDGQTALMNAADDDSIENVRALLEAGAKANLKNSDGETAWDLTSEDDIKELLVSYGGQAKVRTTETKADRQEAADPVDN